MGLTSSISSVSIPCWPSIDGSQHTGLIAYDAERSSFLERRGFKVIRFWNHEVLAQTDRVREAIRQRIEELMGSPTR